MRRFRVNLGALQSRNNYLIPPGTGFDSVLFRVPVGAVVNYIVQQDIDWELSEGESSYTFSVHGCEYLAGLGVETLVATPGLILHVLVSGVTRTA